jgi:hypothetical protein
MACSVVNLVFSWKLYGVDIYVYVCVCVCVCVTQAKNLVYIELIAKELRNLEPTAIKLVTLTGLIAQKRISLST